MWNKLRAAFQPKEAQSNDGLSNAEAVAALLVYTAKLDDHYGDDERRYIQEILTKQSWDTETTADALLLRAEELCTDSLDYYGFLRVVNSDFDEEARFELLRLLWSVVMVDNILDEYESNMMRRITSLLGVSDADGGRIRREVMDGA